MRSVHGPRTAIALVGIALGVTGHDLLIATVRNPLLLGEVAVTARGPPRHSRDRLRSLLWSSLSSDHSWSKDRGRRARREQREGGKTVNVSQAPIVSEASATVAPPVAGGTVTALPSAVQDLARFFLSLMGSSSQGAVGSVAGATVPASGASAPGVGAAASCAATATSSVAARPPSVSTAVPGSSDRQQREEGLSHPSRRRRRRLSSGGTGCMSKKRPRERSPSLVALLVAERSPICLLRVFLKKIEPSLLLPPLDVRMEVHLAIHAPSWRPWSSAAAERYRSGFGGHLSSPSPGEADDDRSSPLNSLDIDRDDSFRSVLALIQNFHGMEEPAGVPSARCKTSLASIYGLMSETSPAFHLPTSPLLRSLLDDTNLALSKFLEDQTVHGFLPVPSWRHCRYYRTSTSSFPRPYSVPPEVTSITLEKASEVKKRSVSLSASQVSSMETMLSGVCEVASWLDWWLSTCGGFPGESTNRSSCRLREVDSLWVESPGVPG